MVHAKGFGCFNICLDKVQIEMLAYQKPCGSRIHTVFLFSKPTGVITTMRSLEEARAAIREIDVQMASLFQKRMEAAKDIAAYKKERGLQIGDIAHEKNILSVNAACVTDEVIRQYYLTFLQNTIDITKRYEERLVSGAIVAFCGTEGAFAHIAAQKIFPGGRFVSYPSFDDAYLSVVEGESDYAVLPIENSYAGEVGQVMDLMFHGSLYINGLYPCPIMHDLLAVPGAKPEDIRTVISHPQALDQCQPYIRKHGFLVQTEINTAIAAQRVAEMKDPSVAAIASEETADLYKLQILDHDINESKDNTTRFAVFARTKNIDPKEYKGSAFILLFRVNNVAGALAEALQVISCHGFNMNVLRSRPIKTTPWKYYFYAEVEGSPASRNGQDMIHDLKNHCDMLKIVGQYLI